MKAMVIDKFGGPGQLHLAERPIPEPADDEILIELQYTSVNPVDWKIREGYLKESFPHQFPLIPGWDAAGIVRKVGRKVTMYKGGEKVYAYARKPDVQWGTYAEFVTVPAEAAAPMPQNIGFAQAAALPLTALTAWQALFEAARIKPGQTLLIHGGAGGVGGMAIQLARHAGAAAVYTTASARNHDYVRRLGAQHPIDYNSGNFADALLKLEPAGVDVVLDTVGGPVLRESLRAVKRGGLLISVIEPPDAAAAAAREVRTGYVFVSPNGAQLREIAGLIEQGALKPPRIEEMRLDQAPAAQERSRGRHVAGKIVLKIH
jgi:NADPH:quinone reductase-like Zn-dependent oxidoreductase